MIDPVCPLCGSAVEADDSGTDVFVSDPSGVHDSFQCSADDCRAVVEIEFHPVAVTVIETESQ